MINITDAENESRMIRSTDIDVISAVDRRELKGSVVKDGNMNTVAYCYAAELERWLKRRAHARVSETDAL
jgi:hypothetical protein